MAGTNDEDSGLVAFEFPEPKDGEALKGTQVDLETEVVVVDDTPEEDRNRQALEEGDDEPTAEELAQYSEAVRKRIGKLTHKRNDERREREQAERERDEAVRLAQIAYNKSKELEQQISSGQNTVVTQAQKLAESEVERAKAELKKAYEAGDTDQFLVAQEKFTDAQLELKRIKAFQSRKPLQATEEPVKVQPQQVANPTTPQTPSAKAQRWFQDNTWFGKDEDLTNFTRGLHLKLVSEGVDPESDTYYDTLNKRVRSAFPGKFPTGAQTEQTSTTKSNKPANVVAPSGRATTPKRVVLTKTQIAFANRAGIPLADYAREVLLMEKKNG